MDDDVKPGFFIDYPKERDIAVGDLLLYKGQWRKVIKAEHASYYVSIEVEGVAIMEHIDAPLARIAGPLLDALKARDPYR